METAQHWAKSSPKPSLRPSSLSRTCHHAEGFHGSCQPFHEQRVDNGVSKLITKTGVASLKAKKFQEKLLQVEQFLAELWGMKAARTIRCKSFGKAAIRTILALPAKEKLGREPHHQQPNYILRSKINHKPKEPASKSCGTLVNLDQSKDAMFVAIQVGSTYTHKEHTSLYSSPSKPLLSKPMKFKHQWKLPRPSAQSS